MGNTLITSLCQPEGSTASCYGECEITRELDLTTIAPAGNVFPDTLRHLENTLERQLFHFAAGQNFVMVRWLLCLRADPMVTDWNGTTALHVVCRCGSVQTVRDLLVCSSTRTGANCTISNSSQVHTTGQSQSTSLLTAKDRFGWTALHVACAVSRLSVTKELLEQGAAQLDAETLNALLRAQTNQGETVLTLADGDSQLRRLLLDAIVKAANLLSLTTDSGGGAGTTSSGANTANSASALLDLPEDIVDELELTRGRGSSTSAATRGAAAAFQDAATVSPTTTTGGHPRNNTGNNKSQLVIHGRASQYPNNAAGEQVADESQVDESDETDDIGDEELVDLPHQRKQVASRGRQRKEHADHSSSSATSNITRYEPFFVPRKPALTTNKFRSELAQLGILFFNKDPGIGLAFLVATNVVQDFPLSLTTFLKRNTICSDKVGWFLSEPFSLSSVLRAEFINSIRLSHCGVCGLLQRVFSFLAVPPDLVKLDRILYHTAMTFWRQCERKFNAVQISHQMNAQQGRGGGSGSSPSKINPVIEEPNKRPNAWEPEGIEVLQQLKCFEGLYGLLTSCVLLHCNLHSESDETSTKLTIAGAAEVEGDAPGTFTTIQHRKLGKEEWISLNSNIDSTFGDLDTYGESAAAPFLHQLYDLIAAEPIPALQAGIVAFTDEESVVELLERFAATTSATQLVPAVEQDEPKPTTTSSSLQVEPRSGTSANVLAETVILHFCDANFNQISLDELVRSFTGNFTSHNTVFEHDEAFASRMLNYAEGSAFTDTVSCGALTASIADTQGPRGPPMLARDVVSPQHDINKAGASTCSGDFTARSSDTIWTSTTSGRAQSTGRRSSRYANLGFVLGEHVAMSGSSAAATASTTARSSASTSGRNLEGDSTAGGAKGKQKNARASAPSMQLFPTAKVDELKKGDMKDAKSSAAAKSQRVVVSTMSTMMRGWSSSTPGGSTTIIASNSNLLDDGRTTSKSKAKNALSAVGVAASWTSIDLVASASRDGAAASSGASGEKNIILDLDSHEASPTKIATAFQPTRALLSSSTSFEPLSARGQQQGSSTENQTNNTKICFAYLSCGLLFLANSEKTAPFAFVNLRYVNSGTGAKFVTMKKTSFLDSSEELQTHPVESDEYETEVYDLAIYLENQHGQRTQNLEIVLLFNDGRWSSVNTPVLELTFRSEEVRDQWAKKVKHVLADGIAAGGSSQA
ncbi:unnamed protein product [Amoebophrya sp. A120]|nr:unnamed protein product [Amoebophrya sp. A120]|eukprot:GSA120T00008060001.1